MSAAPLIHVQERRRHRHGRRPDQTPKQERSRRSKKGRLSAPAIAGLACLTIVTYGFSCLAGNSLMEYARRDSIRAAERTKAARADVARLRARVDRLTTMSAVDRWAESRGFVPPEGLPAQIYLVKSDAQAR